MYNAHRGMGPPGQAPPGTRLAELLEQVRAEFETQAGRSNEHEHQLHGQMQEMELVRSKIYQLEQTHNSIKQRYEEEIARLRHELEQRGGPGGGPAGSSQPQPPAIGHGPANLFQGIMAGSAAGGGPGLAPPPQEQQGQPGMPGHMQAPGGAPGFNAPPAPPHNPFAYGGQPQGPGVNGYGPQPPQPTASPGPGKPYVGAAGRVDGLATPQQSQPNPYPGSPSVARPTPPPAHQAPPPQPPQQQQQQQQQQLQQQQQRPQLSKRPSTTSINGALSEHATASTATTDPSSTAENSDQDADAEMEDDDSFAMVNPSPIKPQQPIQQQATLEVPRTRPVQQQQQQRNPQFMMPTGAGSPANRAAINMSRSMPNMNMAMQNGGMHGGDMAMAMQGVRGDAMFLE